MVRNFLSQWVRTLAGVTLISCIVTKTLTDLHYSVAHFGIYLFISHSTWEDQSVLNLNQGPVAPESKNLTNVPCCCCENHKC